MQQLVMAVVNRYSTLYCFYPLIVIVLYWKEKNMENFVYCNSSNFTDFFNDITIHHSISRYSSLILWNDWVRKYQHFHNWKSWSLYCWIQHGYHFLWVQNIETNKLKQNLQSNVKKNYSSHDCSMFIHSLRINGLLCIKSYTIIVIIFRKSLAQFFSFSFPSYSIYIGQSSSFWI